MGQDRRSTKVRFAPIEVYDKCVSPGDRMRTLELRTGKDVVKKGLQCGCVWEKTPIEIQHSQDR